MAENRSVYALIALGLSPADQVRLTNEGVKIELKLPRVDSILEAEPKVTIIDCREATSRAIKKKGFFIWRQSDRQLFKQAVKNAALVKIEEKRVQVKKNGITKDRKQLTIYLNEAGDEKPTALLSRTYYYWSMYKMVHVDPWRSLWRMEVRGDDNDDKYGNIFYSIASGMICVMALTDVLHPLKVKIERCNLIKEGFSFQHDVLINTGVSCMYTTYSGNKVHQQEICKTHRCTV